MSIRFRYKTIARPAPLGIKYMPSIPVTLESPKRRLNVIAVVDSGADISILPREIAEILCLDLSGKQEEIIGVGGKSPASKSSINLTVKGPHEIYCVRLDILVTMDEKDKNFPILLGREGFFDSFDITFKNNQKELVLKKI
jgi:hypothetical protein